RTTTDRSSPTIRSSRQRSSSITVNRYLEGMIAYVVPKEDGTMYVYSSMQHPGEVQHQLAHALDIAANNVVVECRRMGGAFGGKESQPGLFTCIAAFLAHKANGEASRRSRR